MAARSRRIHSSGGLYDFHHSVLIVGGMERSIPTRRVLFLLWLVASAPSERGRHRHSIVNLRHYCQGNRIDATVTGIERRFDIINACHGKTNCHGNDRGGFEITPVATTAAEILPVAETTAITNLSGAYRLLSNTGFEEFLAVQGVPWALRRAANGARPIHRITQNGRQLTIRIEGIIESQTTYMIGGPPVETNVRGRIFEDSVEYYGRGIRVNKRALTENYDVTVVRQLSEDGKHITMTSTATFRDEREPVQCVQLFERFE